MQVKSVSRTADAVQWNRIGDLKGLVVPYQRDGVHPEARCVRCKHPLGLHGWIPAPLAPGAIPLHPVDPVTGEAVVPALAPVAADPQVFVKEGKPDIKANNGPEADAALADGYVRRDDVRFAPPADTIEPPPADPYPMPAAPSGVGESFRVGRTLGDRSDLNGLPVCPGNWVVSYPDGEHEICTPDHFPSLFAKANPNESAPFSARQAVR